MISGTVSTHPAAAPGVTTDVRPPAVSLRAVSKAYGHGAERVIAVEHVSLDIREGEFACLVGASGCGKSTLLNLVAGLDKPTTGEVARPGGEATLMFQESALLPWLSAARNVELPMRIAGIGKKERSARAMELLRTVGLDTFADRRPHELSGGMRQRVALARALAQNRQIVLMDEPFGALDAMTRDTLHEEVERVWQASGLSVIFVTHNVREAVRLADRVVVLSSRPGRVIQTYQIDIPRPRRIDSSSVATVAATITDRLRLEVSAHGR